MPPGCNWVCSEIQAVIDWMISGIQDALIGTVRFLFREITGPVVRTPHIQGRSRWVSFAGAQNEPWASLWTDVYLPFVLPLAMGLLFLGIGYVGVRSAAISSYRQKRLFRRIPIALFTIFFWWPVASFCTRFVDSIALVLTDSTDLVQTLNDVLFVGSTGLGSTLTTILLLGFDAVLLFTAAFLVAVRWLLIILLTLTMPLVAVIWVFEEWPLKRFAGIARNIAALYPGLLVGGVAAAVLIRFMYELNLATTSWGLVNDLLQAIMISVVLPFAAMLPILIAFSSNRAVQYAALGATASGVSAASVRVNRAGRTAARTPGNIVKKGAAGVKTLGKPARKGGRAVKYVGKKGASKAWETGKQRGKETAKDVVDKKTGYRDWVRAKDDVKKGVKYWRQRRRQAADNWERVDDD